MHVPVWWTIRSDAKEIPDNLKQLKKPEPEGDDVALSIIWEIQNRAQHS